MVSKKDKKLVSKDEKAAGATTSSTTTTTTSSSKTKSSTSSSTAQSSSTQQSNVVISEVHDINMGSIDDRTMRTLQSQYVVTQPEHAQQPQKAKEHYIYGGTQIVEMGTTIGSELIAHEKNKSTWDGKFVYEGAPERTVLTSWTTKEVITEPTTSNTKTSEQTNVKSGSNTKSTHDVSTESSKLVSDALKHTKTSATDYSTTTHKMDNLKSQTNVNNSALDSNQTSTTTRSTSNWDGTFTKEKDTVDNASATDLLLESERCIAKKAYVTTTKSNDQNLTSTSTVSNIEKQILSNKTTDDSKHNSNLRGATTTTTNTTKTSPSGDRYPISTIQPHSHTFQPDSRTTTINQRNAADHDFTVDEFAQSYSSSSRMEKSSSSSKVIEIVDGKERIVSDKFNESGSTQSKVNEELLKSKYGGGIKPQHEYDQRTAEENIKFTSDNRDKEPIYDRDYRNLHRNIQQKGDNAPVELVKGSYETTRYDDKTHKYITDVRHQENNRQLDSSSRITDSITGSITDSNKTKYDTETSRHRIDNTNLNTSTRSNTSDIYRNDIQTSSNVVDRTTANTSRNNMKTTDARSMLYSSEVFDSKTNTWKTVDQSNLNEYSERTSPTQRKPSDLDRTSPTRRKPSDQDRRSPTKNIDLKSSNDTTSSKTTTKDKRQFTDIKTINDSKSTIDKTSRTDTTKSSITKTSDQKVSQQLYDEKTKTWREVDEKTIKSKRPSLIRYVSKDNEGKFTTIYKRKLFDKRSGTWKVVDEKVYKNNNFNEHIPEVIEDVTNVTTTTYTTKVFDTKTNTWKIVDEQTFTDRNTLVPKDIADEIARDQPDIANITTTTELTKVNMQMKIIFFLLIFKFLINSLLHKFTFCI